MSIFVRFQKFDITKFNTMFKIYANIFCNPCIYIFIHYYIVNLLIYFEQLPYSY